MNNIMPSGYRAMVVSPHYMASLVGSSVLQKGGNAFDAAVAVSAALSVVYPHMTGLGGDSFFLLYSAQEKRVVGLNGSGRAGVAAKPELYLEQGMDSIPDRGIRSIVTVPGMIDAWWRVWSRYGRLEWSEVLAPAAEYAEQGFPISRDLHRWMVKDESLLLKDDTLKTVYFRNGKLLKEGDRLIQRELAETFRHIMKNGRDGFYTGPFMKVLVRSLREAGAVLTEEDFIGHESDWVEPVSTSYRGSEVYQMPPNSQGFSLLMMLNILEREPLGDIPRGSAAFYHLVTEAVKKAFVYRDKYLSDPEFVNIPLAELTSKTLAEKLHAESAFSSFRASRFESAIMGQDTAYAAVVDDEGNAASFIQSLYYDFGSGVVAGDTGIIMQNRGSFFSLKQGHPNELAPKKRTFHTLMPGMVLRDGCPYLLIGTQGGEGQPQTNLSLLTGVLDYGCTIQEAIGLPRWVYGRTWGEDSDSLKLENRGLDHGADDRLREWGHEVELLSPWDGVAGQAQGIMISSDGLISGAADPRGDGAAIGW
ncbi:gamma-glutamyltransferase [Paenibacillus piri]|uniref:Glutathione hydrolase proenzyme n=1 Tax=Paenibacillus piri TaxID=2547395 RepID=A0A4R5KI59_9BACL|nr:gamma-glutamyltransferase [Paenibacillus piri]TDF94448.1 gamma-glutamyltransferase [Paenibacillus piri]